jgi:hypothetical protein
MGVARETSEMTSPAPTVFRILFADTLACTRCGSENVFPALGPFGALGMLVGLARHHCRPCGRPFWTKASAEYAGVGEAEVEDSDEPLDLFGNPSTEPADPAALDIDECEPDFEPVDLAALDAEFARRCAPEKQPSRRRRRKAAARA